MNEVIIPQSLAQAIHDYLVSRPMVEVEGLVSGIRQARPVGTEALSTQRGADT